MSSKQNIKKDLPHLGSLVRNKIIEQKMNFAEVSRRMGIKPSTINNYFNQKSLQTRIIWKLSLALEYNIFADIMGFLPENIQKENASTIQNQKVSQQQEIMLSQQQEILSQKQEIADLKKEIAIYKEILTQKLSQ